MVNLSHDVRTPLTTLLGYLDAIHRGVVTGAERDACLEVARGKACELKQTVDDLFTWSKLQAGEPHGSAGRLFLGHFGRAAVQPVAVPPHLNPLSAGTALWRWEAGRGLFFDSSRLGLSLSGLAVAVALGVLAVAAARDRASARHRGKRRRRGRP